MVIPAAETTAVETPAVVIQNDTANPGGGGDPGGGGGDPGGGGGGDPGALIL